MKRLLALLAGALFTTHAQSASVYLRPIEGGLFTVRIEDRIEPGDVEKIKKVLKKARREHQMVVALELASWGGDADTGMAIAQFVYYSHMNVLMNGICSSACSYAALVALGTGHMVVRPTAVMGVHQVYDNGTHDPDRPWTERAARKLRTMGAPKAPLEAMCDTEPSGMTWYYVDELTGMGAIRLED